MKSSLRNLLTLALALVLFLGSALIDQNRALAYETGPIDGDIRIDVIAGHITGVAFFDNDGDGARDAALRPSARLQRPCASASRNLCGARCPLPRACPCR